jgi:predicted ArsR family transcriptional regulator
MKNILQYLKIHGERLDTEIAKGAGISLTQVRLRLAELTASGEVISCHTTRFVNGNKTEGTSCRLAGYTPPASPGRKS